MTPLLAALEFWYFLVSGYGFATRVGPFAARNECELYRARVQNPRPIGPVLETYPCWKRP